MHTVRLQIATAAFLCLAVSSALGQTYLGVLTSPANGGPGASCCSNVAKITASNASVPSDGSCSGCTVITQTQYAAYLTGVAAVSNASVQSKLTSGVAVTFSSTTSANATYAADPATLAGYQAEINNLFVAGTFIGAAALLSVKDTSGTGHSMGGAAFKALVAALQTYTNSVNAAQATAITGNLAPVWPTATASVTG